MARSRAEDGSMWIIAVVVVNGSLKAGVKLITCERTRPSLLLSYAATAVAKASKTEPWICFMYTAKITRVCVPSLCVSYACWQLFFFIFFFSSFFFCATVHPFYDDLFLSLRQLYIDDDIDVFHGMRYWNIDSNPLPEVRAQR